MKHYWKLGIVGIIAFATIAFAAADKYITSSGDVVIKTATSKKVNLQDTLYTTQAGKVGVGAANPASKFQVDGTTTLRDQPIMVELRSMRQVQVTLFIPMEIMPMQGMLV